jgi:hypothetical protein
MQFDPLTLSILGGIANCCPNVQPERGLELLALALHHPAGSKPKQDAAASLITTKPSFPPLPLNRPRSKPASDLETVIATIQAELSQG